MNKIIGEQDSLKLAKEALEGTDKEKSPKLYKSREDLVEALEYGSNQKIRAEKAEKKTPKKKEDKPSKKQNSKDSDNLDYALKEAQKANLTANGIKGKDEHKLAFDRMKGSGLDVDEVVENKYFMEDLKEMREAKAIDEATPKSDGSRPTSTPKSEAGYWVAKGEMPPNTPENQKLRQDIVNAKMKNQSDGSPFSSNPVVGGRK